MKATESLGIQKANVKKFDLKFEEEGLPCINCKFDILLKVDDIDITSLKFIEFKSYLNASKISLDQFLNYIATVSNLSQMKYVFNAAKLSEAEAKAGMKIFMLKNAQRIFDTNQAMFMKINKADGSGKISEVSDLRDLINSEMGNNIIYSIILRQ